jgi:hypothetical protein
MRGFAGEGRPALIAARPTAELAMLASHMMENPMLDGKATRLEIAIRVPPR